MKRAYLFLSLVFIVFLSACGPSRNLVYFSDLSDSTAYTAQILNNTEPKIQSGDILEITVNTLNPESNSLFNKGILPSLNTVGNTGLPYTSPSASSSGDDGYLVDKAGQINFPVIGKITLAGLTKEEARKLMVDKVSQYVKNPIINIRYLNFRITVIGEVNRPGSFLIPNEKVNVLEALGMAGDMTVYGRRDDVLVIREKNDQRTMARLNMNSKDVFNSPFFYLQQNDEVYVVPHVLKRRQSSDNLRIISILISTATLITLAVYRLR